MGCGERVGKIRHKSYKLYIETKALHILAISAHTLQLREGENNTKTIASNRKEVASY